MSDVAITADPPKKKGFFRRLLKWCFWLFILFILLIAIVAALIFRVPHKLGLIPNVAKKHMVLTPDREGARRILKAAIKRGMPAKGVNLYVIPYKKGDASIILLHLDASEGFKFNAKKSKRGPIGDTFVQVASGSEVQGLGIERVSMVYFSKYGKDLMTMSASRSDILQYANGKLTKKTFMEKVDGDINLPAMIDEQIQTLKKYSKTKDETLNKLSTKERKALKGLLK